MKNKENGDHRLTLDVEISKSQFIVSSRMRNHEWKVNLKNVKISNGDRRLKNVQKKAKVKCKLMMRR